MEGGSNSNKMSEQQRIRKMLLEYLDESGCKQVHICKKTGIKTDILSRWKNDIIHELWEDDLQRLEEYLQSV